MLRMMGSVEFRAVSSSAKVKICLRLSAVMTSPTSTKSSFEMGWVLRTPSTTMRPSACLTWMPNPSPSVWRNSTLRGLNAGSERI